MWVFFLRSLGHFHSFSIILSHPVSTDGQKSLQRLHLQVSSPATSSLRWTFSGQPIKHRSLENPSNSPNCRWTSHAGKLTKFGKWVIRSLWMLWSGGFGRKSHVFDAWNYGPGKGVTPLDVPIPLVAVTSISRLDICLYPFHVVMPKFDWLEKTTTSWR